MPLFRSMTILLPTWQGWILRRAFQNGEGAIHRRRYHHPDVSIEDMLA